MGRKVANLWRGTVSLGHEEFFIIDQFKNNNLIPTMPLAVKQFIDTYSYLSTKKTNDIIDSEALTILKALDKNGNAGQGAKNLVKFIESNAVIANKFIEWYDKEC